MDRMVGLHRARVLCTSLVAVAVLASGTAGAAHHDPCRNRSDAAYATHACKVTRLQERPFVVVAVPDTGINPYHADFRLPASSDLDGVHPSEFIEGFPADALPFELALGASTYTDAVAADRQEWDQVEQGRVYTFPGTKIIGGLTFGEDSGLILDEAAAPSYGHGTSVASLAVGAIHGSSPDTETLLVAVQGLDRAIGWAMRQPWIDIVSVSAHCPVPLACRNFRRYSREFVDRGGIAVVGAGNGITGIGVPCLFDVATASDTAGPPWLVIVGAASSRNRQPSCWHDIPPDIVAYGDYVIAASAESITEEVIAGPGTSFSTPIAAGIVAAVVLEARRIVGDTSEGPHSGGLAVGVPHEGLLEDGTLSAHEAEAVVLKTARVEPFKPVHLHQHPWIWPNTPAYFVYAGYGLVNERSKRDALDVMIGRAPMPDRSDVDTWMAHRDTVSGTFWASAP